MENIKPVVPVNGELKDEVSYTEKSIVSKQLIKMPAGNITLFAFDKGEGLSEHSAPFDAFVQILDGRAEVKIAGKPFILNEGQFIIMPANIPHALTAIEKFKMMLVMIKA